MISLAKIIEFGTLKNSLTMWAIWVKYFVPKVQ